MKFKKKNLRMSSNSVKRNKWICIRCQNISNTIDQVGPRTQDKSGLMIQKWKIFTKQSLIQKNLDQYQIASRDETLTQLDLFPKLIFLKLTKLQGSSLLFLHIKSDRTHQLNPILKTSKRFGFKTHRILMGLECQ